MSAPQDPLRAALRALWAWAVKTGPFINGVLVLADDKAPALELLAEVPALREQVIAALAATPERREDGWETNCPLEGVHEHAFRGPHRFREWEPGT